MPTRIPYIRPFALSLSKGEWQKTKINTAGGCPAASHFLLLRQKKVTKEKATPVCRRCAVPCVARLVRRLRNSRCALRQSSPKPPDQSALLGGAQGEEKRKPKAENRVGNKLPTILRLDRQYNSTPHIWILASKSHSTWVFSFDDWVFK